jgi:pimeloyl-ACP methyl ester carboxylesterase
MLDVGDGNRIYWEACGNPEDKPAVVLHSGPGSGCSTRTRRYFDPNACRIVLFDQGAVAGADHMPATWVRIYPSIPPNTY